MRRAGPVSRPESRRMPVPETRNASSWPANEMSDCALWFGHVAYEVAGLFRRRMPRQVGLRQDAAHLTVGAHHRQTTDLVRLHHLDRIADLRITRQGHRRLRHAV